MVNNKIIGGILFIILLITAIVLFVSAWNDKSTGAKGTLYSLSIVIVVVAFIVGISSFLLEQCENNFENMDRHITEMYKFSTSYLFNIPENQVVIPETRSIYSNNAYSNFNGIGGVQVGPSAPNYIRR